MTVQVYFFIIIITYLTLLFKSPANPLIVFFLHFINQTIKSNSYDLS